MTDDRRRMPSDGKSSHRLWQGELKTSSQISMTFISGNTNYKKETSYLPLSKSLSCGPFGAPPYTHTFLILEDLPNSLATSCTCCASSLVGTNTRT